MLSLPAFGKGFFFLFLVFWPLFPFHLIGPSLYLVDISTCLRNTRQSRRHTQTRVFTPRRAERPSDRAIQFMHKAFSCASIRLKINTILTFLRAGKPGSTWSSHISSRKDFWDISHETKLIFYGEFSTFSSSDCQFSLLIFFSSEALMLTLTQCSTQMATLLKVP